VVARIKLKAETRNNAHGKP